ncbi:MAG: lysophospholipase [Deltaproteobacteria bacterium]|nr:lysophospholipase [Deltaproteobacteria bacterium]
MDARIGKFSVRDGTELYYEHWHLPNFKAVIVLVHGLGDHCGRYGSFVDFFTKQGYRVCVYDQRGHGKSGGKRAYADRMEVLLDDLDQFVLFSRRETKQECPWFIVGHSFGGQLILNFLARRPTLFHAACATSPNLQVAFEIPEWKKRLARMVLSFWPTMRFKNLTKPEWISHDAKAVEAFQKDPLVSLFVTAQLGDEILKNQTVIFSLCTILHTPLLLLHGEDDLICAASATKQFYNQLVLAEKGLKIYEGMYHELFNEVNKQEVFEDVDAWFKKCI